MGTSRTVHLVVSLCLLVAAAAAAAACGDNLKPATSDKDITAFTLAGVAATIDGNMIDATLPYGTDVTALAPTIVTTGTSVAPASGATQDFSHPTTYTVTAADHSTKNYVVTVAVAASDTHAITKFSVLGVDGTITGDQIAVTLPYGTTIVALTPHIEYQGADLEPPSEVTQDFTHPVPYVVTAPDGSTATYTVTITLAANDAKDITSFVIGTAHGTIGTSTIAVTVPHDTDVTMLAPTITITGTSVSPSSGTIEDFTNPVSYVVTAADGTIKTYTVTVTTAPLCDPTVVASSTGMFVDGTHGSDANAGTLGAPKQTITAALTAIHNGVSSSAGTANVYVAPGTYAETVTFPTSTHGISVQGSWIVGATQWTQDCSASARDNTIVQGTTTAVISTVTASTNGVDNLTIETESAASAAARGSAGTSLIAVEVRGAGASFLLINDNVIAGHAGDGGSASPASAPSAACTYGDQLDCRGTTTGTAGSAGAAGSAGSDGSGSTFADTGYTGAAGTAGGPGGSGQIGEAGSDSCVTPNTCTATCDLDLTGTGLRTCDTPGTCGLGGCGAGGGGAGQPGGASVAVLVGDSGANVRMEGCALTSGSGGSGSPGAAGGAATEGTSGSAAAPTCVTSETLDTSDPQPCGIGGLGMQDKCDMSTLCAMSYAGTDGGDGGDGGSGGGGTGGPSYAIVLVAGATVTLDADTSETHGTGGAGAGGATSGSASDTFTQ
jgi:hypothetical protein